MRLSFKTQFKIEFLLPFTCCRKVRRKVPGYLAFTKRSYVLKQTCSFQLQVRYLRVKSALDLDRAKYKQLWDFMRSVCCFARFDTICTI